MALRAKSRKAGILDLLFLYLASLQSSPENAERSNLSVCSTRGYLQGCSPADLPNLPGWAQTIPCPLQLFWLPYKKLLHCRNAKFGLPSPLCFECGTVASSQHLQAINTKHCDVRDPITLPSLALKTCLWQVCGWQNLTFKSFYSPQCYLLACWNLQSAYQKDNTSVTRSIPGYWKSYQVSVEGLTGCMATPDTCNKDNPGILGW